MFISKIACKISIRRKKTQINLNIFESCTIFVTKLIIKPKRKNLLCGENSAVGCSSAWDGR